MRSSSNNTDIKHTPKQKPQRNLDNWVARRQPTRTKSQTENEISEEISKKRKIAAISPNDFNDKQNEESKKLRALREEWEKIEKKVTIDEV